MRDKLRKIPKIEFHRHLDGSVRFKTIKDLIKENNLKITFKNEKELFSKCKVLRPLKNLEEVLDSFWTTQKTLCHFDAIKRITFENVEDAYQDGVIGLELRFAPTFIKDGKNHLGYDEIIEGVIEGLRIANEKFPVKTGLIFIAPRTLSYEENIKALKLFLDYKKRFNFLGEQLVGFDLADNENGYPPQDFLEMVNIAREGGLKITIHSGEDTNAYMMKETIDCLHPLRIGHGIKSIEDEKLLQEIKEKNILLEVCPTSNYLTRSVESLEKHPFPELLNKKIPISLNSDDPQLMNIDLINEYEVAHKIFHMSENDLYDLNKKSIDYLFLNDDMKREIKKSF